MLTAENDLLVRKALRVTVAEIWYQKVESNNGSHKTGGVLESEYDGWVVTADRPATHYRSQLVRVSSTASLPLLAVFAIIISRNLIGLPCVDYKCFQYTVLDSGFLIARQYARSPTDTPPLTPASRLAGSSG